MTTPPANPAAIAALQGALAYTEDWIAYRAFTLRVPGVQYAVLFDGEVQLSGAVGLANVETGTPLTTGHLFRVASHSKTFTATAVLQLVEAGQLTLDTRLSDVLGELADAPSGIGSIAVRELLEHGGGVIRDGLDGDYWQLMRPFPDEAELLQVARAEGVKADANARFDYSNIGYSLLGLVVARVSGRTYNDYVRGEIVARLGLADTDPEWIAARAADYATGYTGFATSLDRRPIADIDTRAMSAATGFTSTAEDLVRYLSAHRLGDGRLLSDASKRLQQRGAWQSVPDRPESRRYGLGMVVETVAGRRLIGHSGGFPGYITYSLLAVDDGIAVSVLTNAVDGPAAELAHGTLKLLDAALKRPASLPLAEPAEPSVADASSARFEGRFANLWGVLDIVRLGDRLLGIDPSGPDPVDGNYELAVVDDDTLRITAGDGFGSVGELIHYTTVDGQIVRIRGDGGMTMWPFDVGEPFAPPGPA
jgi:D-alanyl-D-alanine carboxypeptidase